MRRPEHLAFPGQTLGCAFVDHTGDAKVEQLDEVHVGARAHDDHVVRLQVAMDDAAFVRFMKRRQDLPGDVEMRLVGSRSISTTASMARLARIP
ncbi:MAG: hypothetical protein R3E66_03990 [bacterium]